MPTRLATEASGQLCRQGIEILMQMTKELQIIATGQVDLKDPAGLPKACAAQG